MTFVALVLHNVAVRKLRLALTTLAVAVGVVTVVSLGVVTHSLESSDLALLATGRADFTVAQKGVSDILTSSINEAQLSRVAASPGVASITGVLIATTRVNAGNPLFVEIGINPAQLVNFGVTVDAGRQFGASATDEVMLGWRAAENLGKHIGDRIQLDTTSYRIVGIYSTGQALGDAGAMVPLTWFQSDRRQAGQLTLLFVQTAPRTDIAALQARIDRDNPTLVAIRTAAQFGRADRSLALITAANRGSTVLAIVIGAIIVMSAMTMSFIERRHEFGVLSAIGWPRLRVMTMIMAEAMVIGLLGAAAGSGLGVAAIRIVQDLPSLAGVLHPDFTPSVFARALYTAAAMTVLGGLYPALRAAFTTPIEALRNE